jgi:hypothetical protein
MEPQALRELALQALQAPLEYKEPLVLALTVPRELQAFRVLLVLLGQREYRVLRAYLVLTERQGRQALGLLEQLVLPAFQVPLGYKAPLASVQQEPQELVPLAPLAQ